MAQLKLMKKEWFNWFDKTFLDNITAWTEYYYINPDRQHWISNNLIVRDADYTFTTKGVTGLWRNGRMGFTGTGDESTSDIYFGFTIPLKLVGSYTLTGFFVGNNPIGTRLTYVKNGNRVYTFYVDQSNRSKTQVFNGTETDFILEFVIRNNGATYDNHFIYPMLVQGTTAPGAFSPHLIKIEDVLGVVAMKDLSWTYEGGNIFAASRASLPSDMPSFSPSEPEPAKIFSAIYEAVKPALIFQSQSDMAIGLSGVLRVKDKRFDDIDDFTGFIQDQYIVYLKTTSPLGQ